MTDRVDRQAVCVLTADELRDPDRAPHSIDHLIRVLRSVDESFELDQVVETNLVRLEINLLSHVPDDEAETVRNRLEVVFVTTGRDGSV